MSSRQLSHTKKATFVGFLAIIMWALLALFTKASGKVPPLQLLAMTFALATACGMTRWLFKPSILKEMKLPLLSMVVGIGGLFGYHLLYYVAIRNAPVAEASLIAYLWPLLIVLLSTLLPNEKFHLYHLIGAICGFVGIAFLIGPSSFGSGNAIGYLAAISCAFIWSSYSVLSRLFKSVPTDAVTVFCLATAILGLLFHLMLEETVWPENITQWLAVIGLGTMPVGTAFYAWDHGVKHGNIQLLGTMAYFAPVLSILVLIVTGFAEPTFQLLAACLLVTAGALIASGALTKNR